MSAPRAADARGLHADFTLKNLILSVFARFDFAPRLHAERHCAYLFYVALKWQRLDQHSNPGETCPF
jgi:hypothetical protein